MENTYKRVVVKVGSSLITDKENRLDNGYLDKLAGEISVLSREGREVIIVSSGAIACGMRLFGLNHRPSDLALLQAAASAGQVFLMSAYQESFRKAGLKCAQMLLTWDDFDDRKRYVNAKNTLAKLFYLKAVPVINENDTVATDEVKFGDNDRLSAMAACMSSAQLLLILSDVEGLYRDLDTKEVIPFVDEVTHSIEKLACGSNKAKCVGGMRTKLEAVKIASGSGITTVITSGSIDSVISRLVLKNEALGTFFVPKRKGREAKKNWIACVAKPRGVLYVDQGAQEAIVCKNKSLLKVGIRGMEGSFFPGDVVEIKDDKDRVFARGIVSSPSDDLKDYSKKEFNKEVVNRDNLVVL